MKRIKASDMVVGSDCNAWLQFKSLDFIRTTICLESSQAFSRPWFTSNSIVHTKSFVSLLI